MTYDEATETGAVVAKSRAAREITDHQCDPNEFFAEHGIHAFYSTRVILEWLGY